MILCLSVKIFVDKRPNSNAFCAGAGDPGAGRLDEGELAAVWQPGLRRRRGLWGGGGQRVVGQQRGRRQNKWDQSPPHGDLHTFIFSILGECAFCLLYKEKRLCTFFEYWENRCTSLFKLNTDWHRLWHLYRQHTHRAASRAARAVAQLEQSANGTILSRRHLLAN